MTETELWEWMMEGNYPGFSKGEGSILKSTEHRMAIATLTKDIVLKKWQGHGQNDLLIPMKKGQKVKVVMASRFGHVGITDNLSATHGYHFCVNCVEGEVMNRRVYPDGILTDIEKIVSCK